MSTRNPKSQSQSQSQSRSLSEFDIATLPNRSAFASAGGHANPVRTNAHPLDTFIDPASLRVERKYDWQTGTMHDVPGDVLTNARRHMTRLSIHAETAGRTTRDQDRDNCPMGLYGSAKGLKPLAPALQSRTRTPKGKVKK